MPVDFNHLDGARSYSRAELARVASVRKVRTSLTNGQLVRLLPGRLVLTAHAEAFAPRAHAAAMWAGKGARLSGLAALHLCQARSEAPPHVLVVVPHGRSLSPPPWIRVVHARAEVTADFRGAALDIPEFALIRAAALMAPRDAQALTLEVLQRRAVSTERVRHALASLPRVRHRTIIARALDAFDLGAQSYLELTARDTVIPQQVRAEFTFQHKVRTTGGTFALDAYHPASRTAVEFDGATHHNNPDAWQADIARDAWLATEGILALHFSYRDVMDRPQQCMEVIASVVRSRKRH